MYLTYVHLTVQHPAFQIFHDIKNCGFITHLFAQFHAQPQSMTPLLYGDFFPLISLFSSQVHCKLKGATSRSLYAWSIYVQISADFAKITTTKLIINSI